MIRVAVLYPNSEGSSFDVDYYINKHMPLVQDRLQPYGLLGWEVDAGLAGLDNAPAPFACIGYLLFTSQKEFHDGLAKVGEELFADVPNYTNITPVVQISAHTKG
jgi:uncharacterized protein (TIGR02118 family)